MSNPDLKTTTLAPQQIEQPPIPGNIGQIATTSIAKSMDAPNNRVSSSDLKNYIKSAGDIAAQNVSRAPGFAKLYEYGGRDITGNSFERYYAYGNKTFGKLGFNPYRDNESLYNANTSSWADYGRNLRYSVPGLLSAGFVDGAMSIPQMFGNIGGVKVGDLDQARRYAKASDIGYSSKSGLIAGASNVTMSASYTVGMMAETMAEFAIASLLTPTTGGGSLVAAATSAASKVPRALRLINAAGKSIRSAVPRLDQAMKAMSNTAKAIKSLNNWSVAKTYWTAAATNSLKFVNPLQGSVDAIATLRNAKNLGAMAAVTKSAGQFYGNLKEITSAASEANLEAGFVKDEIFNAEYENFITSQGRTPTNEELDRLIKTSQDGATRTYLQNAGLIFYSNRLVFSKVFKPFPAINRYLSGSDVIKFGAGKMVNKTVKDATGKSTGKIIKEYVDNSFINQAKESVKKRALTKTLVNGFLTNMTEGFQENFQEAFSAANVDYYRSVYQNPGNKGNLLYHIALKDGLKSQISGQGLETFISGFVMGPLVGRVRGGVMGTINLVNSARNKEAVVKWKKLSRQIGEEYAKKINEEADNNLSDYLDPKVLFASEIEMLDNQMVKSAAESDRRGYLDQRSQMFISKVIDAVKSNSLDLFLENISSLKEMDAQGVMERLNLSNTEEAENVLNNIETLIKRASGVQKTYENMQKELPNPYPKMNITKTSSPEEIELAMRHKSWNNMVDGLTTYFATYDDNVERLSKMIKLVNTLKPLRNAKTNDFSILLDQNQLSSEIELLNSEINALKDSTNPADVSRVETLRKKQNILDRYRSKMIQYNTTTEELATIYIQSGAVKYNGEVVTLDSYRALSPADKEIINTDLKSYIEERKKTGLEDLKEIYYEYIDSVFSGSGTIYAPATNGFWLHIRDYLDIKNDNELIARALQVNSDYNNFVLNVERNYAFMQELYERREDDHREFVKQGLKNELANAFLNHLADKYNLFVDPAEFAEFLESGEGITYFINETDKTLIDENNPMFSEYMKYFINLKEIYDSTGKTEEAAPELSAEVAGEVIPDITDEETSVASDSASMVDGVITPAKAEELLKDLGTFDEVLRELESKLEC